MAKKTKEPEAPPPPPPAVAKKASPDDTPTALQVLAELELVRRKAELLERRIAVWENGLDDVRKAISRLEGQVGPPAAAPEDELAELRHRVARLERRREAQATTVRATESGPMRPLLGAGRADDTEAVAIVRARWDADAAKPGDTVALSARCDGIPAGTSLPVVIRSLVEARPLAELTGKSDGDRISATWTVPAGLPYPEVIFEVRHQDAVARSPVLELAVGSGKKKKKG